jgi:hypothetical protein
MKKVAATRGHSVSLAVLDFDLGRARDLISAGRDSVLNFLSLVLLGEVRSHECDPADSAFAEYSFLAAAQEKNMPSHEYFCIEPGHAPASVDDAFYSMRNWWRRRL